MVLVDGEALSVRSNTLFNARLRWSGFLDIYSITLQCVADCLYNIVYYNVHNSYTMTVLKKCPKVGVSRSSGVWCMVITRPPSFLELSAQNAVLNSIPNSGLTGTLLLMHSVMV